jgi:hypothetical protein
MKFGAWNSYNNYGYKTESSGLESESLSGFSEHDNKPLVSVAIARMIIVISGFSED